MTGVGGQARAVPERALGISKETLHTNIASIHFLEASSKEALFYFHTLHNSGSPLPREQRSLALSPEALCKATESFVFLPARAVSMARSEH